jgi:hypothetical protein
MLEPVRIPGDLRVPLARLEPRKHVVTDRLPLCLCFSYAIAEPIVVLVLRASGIPPWILTLGLSPFCASATFVFVLARDTELTENLPLAKDKGGGPNKLT